MRLDLPTGTVTFLFTDVEGSTRLLHELGAEGYAEALAEHRRLIRQACATQGGVEVDNQGDAFFFAFASAPGASAAASELTRALGTGPIRVRVGLHTGAPLLTEEGYVGDDVHVAARVASSGHGGQVLLSQVTRELLDERFPLASLGSHRLKDIAEAVSLYQLGEGSFPPLKTIANTNLPTPASGFLGREAELYEADLLLQRTRLLTVTGPGGQGKTRFSLELARRAREERFSEYEDGVFSCFLSSLRDPALVLPTLCHTLCLPEQPGRSALETLASQLEGKQTLLLLDNLEHLLACASELSQLLERCPQLTLLCTSRELLRLSGELAYALPPLADDEGVSLFCQRARTEPTATIAELCRRLEGLPLAIELAAARMRLLSPEQLLERLAGRLDLLKGTRDADPRHETLRATIQWSYDLLAEVEQRLFARLAVFAGGCTLEAAEEVAGAELDTLESLLDKSLVRRTDSESGPRFWMLETIREYALEKLEESEDAAATVARHTDYFVRLADEADPGLDWLSDFTWLDRLEQEHDNVRTALARVRELGQGELELRLAVNLGAFRTTRGYLAESRLSLEQALVVGKDPKLRARALQQAGFMALLQGRHDEAEALLEEGWRLAQQLDDVELTSHLLLTLAGAVSDRDEARADALYNELLVFVQEHGEERFPTAFLNLADFALRRGDHASAAQHSRKCLLFLGEEGDASTRALALGNLGLALLGLGREAEAWEQLADSLHRHVSIGDRHGIATSLSALASVIAERGELERATRLLAHADLLLGEMEAEISGLGLEGALHERTLARARAEVEEFETVWSQGREMTLREAVAEALGEATKVTS